MEEIKVHVVEYPDRDNLVLRYLDPMTQRYKTKSARTSDRKKAEKAAAIWEDELRSGRATSPGMITWKEFRERYEAEVMPGMASGTQTRVDVVFDRLEAVMNPQRVRDITAQRLSWLVAELRKNVKVGDKTKPGLTESSIQSYLAQVKSALRWAESVGLIGKAPKFPKLQRTKGGDVMKGRPISGEEFDRMIAATPKIVGDAYADEWRRYLRGLWWSGFRIGESLVLSWDDVGGLAVDLSGRHPVVHIAAESQKSHKTETVPLAPEFAKMLAEVPKGNRVGLVFNPRKPRLQQRASLQTAIRTVSAIGEAAGVKVWTNPKSGGVKYATAHDLRRAFGLRWSSRVMPAVLQQMMRHASIQTTMLYYVGKNAQQSAAVIWEAFEKTAEGNKSGNIAPIVAEQHEREFGPKSL